MGIAGAGMSALARLLVDRGVAVSGCEARESATVTALRAFGAEVLIGHSAAHLDGADTFVYTTAISPSHPEFVAARASGKRVLRRAAALASVLEDKRSIAISGTHGKTTTTSLLTVALRPAASTRPSPSAANLYETGPNAHLGTRRPRRRRGGRERRIVPADAPGSPRFTNVEADHLENHGDLEGIFRAFEQFVDRIAPGGLVLCCADDPGARRIGTTTWSRPAVGC